MLKVCVLKTFFINVHSLPDVDVVVGSAVTASELIWYRLSADQEDDNVVSVDASVSVVVAEVTKVTAMVGLVPGVVFP